MSEQSVHKKKHFGEKPIIPWILEKERDIKNWHFEGNTLIIEPAKANFERLLCTSRYNVTSLYYWRICSILGIVKDGKMSPKAEDLYRQLKRLECELFWKGILTKKPVFQAYRALKMLVSKVPSIQPDATLAEKLNVDDILANYLKLAKPDAMVFYLESTYGLSYEDENAFMEDILRFYEKPARIAWNIALYKGIDRRPGVRGLVTNLYDALDRASGILKAVTRSITEASR